MIKPLTALAEVQTLVGKLPAPRDMKVIDHLDVYAQRWIAASSLVFAAFGQNDQIAVTLAGGPRGFVQTTDPHTLLLPLELLDETDRVQEDMALGALFLISGKNETLRVNGRVQSIDNGLARIQVEECYLHCAKAFMRSGFWDTPPAVDIPTETYRFLAASRFMALATIGHDGGADLSPKGDPAGALLSPYDGAIWFPDRPGNRRIDSFRNILSQPNVALLALIPGWEHVVQISGRAEITTDETMKQAFAVQGNVPKLVTRVIPQGAALNHSPALVRARLWPASPPPEDLEAPAIFKAHLKLNQTKGLSATLTRAATSIPGAMEKGLAYDYKKNLY